MSVAAVGDPIFVTCFELIGAVGFRVKSGAEAADVLKKLVEEGRYKLIILPERFAKDTFDVRFTVMRKGALWPIFALVPDPTGERGMRLEELKSIVCLAVGAELEL